MVSKLCNFRAKEKADVDELEGEDIKENLLKMGIDFDDKMAKEKAELFAAMNKQVKFYANRSYLILLLIFCRFLYTYLLKPDKLFLNLYFLWLF